MDVAQVVSEDRLSQDSENKNFWSDEKEDLLKLYAEESECMYITYTKEYKSYKMFGYGFTIPSIIISTITGLLSFDSNFNNSSDGPFIIGSLNILVAVLSTIYKVLKYAELEAQFRFLSIEHLKLYSEIQSTLAKAPLERDNAVEYVRKIEARRLQMLDDAPVITKKTENMFLQKYRDQNIQIPLLLNKINKIRIYGRKYEDDIKEELDNEKPSLLRRTLTLFRGKTPEKIDTVSI